MAQLLAFIRLGRPLFLLGGLLFHALGLTLALYEGAEFSLLSALLTQLAISSSQLMTHYSNEYYDLPADRLNQTITYWAGGSRVLVEGHLPASVARRASQMLALLALGSGLILLLLKPHAPFSFPLILIGLLFVWQYSAPPLKLHWRGWGAFSAALLVPGLAATLGYYGQAGQFSTNLWLLIMPLALLQAAMIILIDFPDRAGDAAAGKRTLVVKLGLVKAARLHLQLMALGYLVLPLLGTAGLPWPTIVATALPAPLGFWLSWQLYRCGQGKTVNWNWLGFLAIALLMATASLQLLTLILGLE